MKGAGGGGGGGLGGGGGGGGRWGGGGVEEDLELREEPFIRRVVLHADQSLRGELFD